MVWSEVPYFNTRSSTPARSEAKGGCAPPPTGEHDSVAGWSVQSTSPSTVWASCQLMMFSSLPQSTKQWKVARVW
eukprot:659712-Prorocentrum_minimum.AAC.1